MSRLKASIARSAQILYDLDRSRCRDCSNLKNDNFFHELTMASTEQMSDPSWSLRVAGREEEEEEEEPLARPLPDDPAADEPGADEPAADATDGEVPKTAAASAAAAGDSSGSSSSGSSVYYSCESGNSSGSSAKSGNDGDEVRLES